MRLLIVSCCFRLPNPPVFCWGFHFLGVGCWNFGRIQLCSCSLRTRTSGSILKVLLSCSLKWWSLHHDSWDWGLLFLTLSSTAPICFGTRITFFRFQLQASACCRALRCLSWEWWCWVHSSWFYWSFRHLHDLLLSITRKSYSLVFLCHRSWVWELSVSVPARLRSFALLIATRYPVSEKDTPTFAHTLTLSLKFLSMTCLYSYTQFELSWSSGIHFQPILLCISPVLLLWLSRCIEASLFLGLESCFCFRVQPLSSSKDLFHWSLL